MAVSKANQRAVNKYKKNNYDRIEITVPKGQRGVFQAHAAALGESVNGFIGRAISETMERDSRTVSQIAQNGPESTVGAGVVSLPSNAPKATQGAAGPATGGSPDKAETAKSLFGIMGNLGAVNLDESRGECLGMVYFPPDTMKAAQEAAEDTGEAVPDFIRRAVETQAKRDKTSLAMGINPATGGKLEKEA